MTQALKLNSAGKINNWKNYFNEGRDSFRKLAHGSLYAYVLVLVFTYGGLLLHYHIDFPLHFLPFITFAPVILLAGLLLGLIPGIVTATLCAVITYLCITYSIVPGHSKNEDLLPVSILALNGLFITLGIEMVYRYAFSSKSHAVFEHVATAQLAEVIEMMPNPLVIINQQGIVEMANYRAEALFGYPPTELVGKPIEKLMPENSYKQDCPHLSGPACGFCKNEPDLEHPIRLNKAILLKNCLYGLTDNDQPEEPIRKMFFGRRADGEEIPVEITLNTVLLAGERKTVVTLADISERRRMEEQLLRANERFQMAAKAAKYGFWEFDVKTRQFYCDDELLKIYQYPERKHHQTYHHWLSSVCSKDRSRVEATLEETLQTKSELDMEFRIVRKDGFIRYLKAYGVVKESEKSDAAQLFGLSFDITEQKHAQKVLQESETRLHLLVDNIKDYAVVMLNPQGVVVNWNRGAQAILGYTAAEIVGQHFSLFYPPNAIAEGRPEQELAEAAANGRFEEEGDIRVRKDGSQFAAHVIVNAIIQDEQVQGFVKVTRDITLYLAEERQLNRMMQELQRSNEELNNFAYVASHDLRSPMHGIAQLASWIEEDLQENLNSDTKEYLRLMRKRVKRMEMLLDDLLTYSRVGRTQDEIVTVDSGELVRNIFELLNNNPAMQLRLTSEMPVFTTVKTPLELVFRNLLSNALKHHDKPQGIIEISAAITQQVIEFKVKDDGPGIAPEHQQRVFNMFTTLKPRDEVEGSGIGLALVKKTLDTLGGKIDLESDGQHGCTFTVQWPEKLDI